jgi:hypothetical protein
MVGKTSMENIEVEYPMYKFVQIEESEWKELAEPITICVLPYFPCDLSERFNIEFKEFEDEGLGLCQYAVIEIERRKFWLRSYPNGSEMARHITAEVLSYDLDPGDSCSILCKTFEISSDQLLWRRKDLCSAKWLLVRIDDNGNEFEMYRFMEKISAELAMKKYDSKGHKQKYLIKEATEHRHSI